MTSLAIIVAAGKGLRAKRDQDTLPKQFIPVGGKAVLCWTVEKFLTSPHIDYVQVVISSQSKELYQTALAPLADPTNSAHAFAHKLLPATFGGDTRQASVMAGLDSAQKKLGDQSPKPEIEHVHIHDAARPFVSQEILARLTTALQTRRACLVATPISDTVKRTSGDDVIETTLDRTNLWSAQTPQSFQFAFIYDAHKKAKAEALSDFTDDAAVAEWAGAKVHIVAGSRENVKITTQEDLTMAEETLAPQAPLLTDIRVGTGYDVHAFDEGSACIIGGIAIPHTKKLKGHSDADVGLHAITDAILGAIADGDIGTHFPPSDPQWKGAKSDIFLKDAVGRVQKLGGKLSNIDMTIICEEPKIGPHRPAIREAIAEICSLSINRVSVKATTSEQLGFTGRREGIAAIASVCVRLPEQD
ncbi:MAG: bifunctional 2-C-methyl-D-erythritol 4-phosphate cytidylyltransferase/2-C-methyl-D-erythritol 2,4-cyclodiphosphate synthase [Cohaesibacter sp.]|jgi:2-C-methyl-D-erythritol 4-phosphate cytidylyltransferase/2-C-methyl-D-erythritol 2,4-cyclodiphosphate synthase|nr:bifunctional 2-C-methyl-D-erythritol 4-phosphate cytidylyltransferase/2-C-methyl-D-erythritol 2,4-cyclodiphosphate synthase [Cohaesibacter sp.]